MSLALPRFYVVATTGYSLQGKALSSVRTSYAILDRVYCHREVFTEYARPHGGLPDEVRRARCEAKADELNRKHEAWLQEIAA